MEIVAPDTWVMTNNYSLSIEMSKGLFEQNFQNKHQNGTVLSVRVHSIIYAHNFVVL